AVAGDRDSRRHGQHRGRDGGGDLLAGAQRRRRGGMVADVGAARVLRGAGACALGAPAGSVRPIGRARPAPETSTEEGARESAGRRRLAVRLIAAVGLLAVAVVFGLFPVAITDPTATSIAVFTLVFMVATVAWNVFSGYSGYLALGHAVFFGCG